MELQCCENRTGLWVVEADKQEEEDVERSTEDKFQWGIIIYGCRCQNETHFLLFNEKSNFKF